jgi:signal transduction histidine kinase
MSVGREETAMATLEVDETWAAPTARLWEIYFSVCVVAVAVFTFLIATAEPSSDRWVALGLLGVMVVWYVTYGRPVIAATKETWRSWVFQGVLLALFVAAMTVVDSASFLLFALCPLTYMTLRVRRAHAVVAAYAFTPAVLSLIREGPAALSVTLPIGAVVTTISVVIAVTTERSERISDERAALIRELNSTRAEVARLSREAGIAEERQRLAGDIHDTVAQGLSSVVMLVEAADVVLTRDPAAARAHLSLAARTARENLDETRAIVAALTPSPLTDASLADALGRLVERFRQDVGAATSMDIAGDARPVPTGTEVVLLRVAQEALNNVRKHAGASTVSLTLAYGAQTVSVQVRDDGCGFDVAALAPGYGLGGMQTRVEQVGGRLSIASTPGAGTTVRTEVTA